MDIEHATPDDMAIELARRGLHGIIAVDDVDMSPQASEESYRGLTLFGHPVVSLGLAHEAVDRAKSDLRSLSEGD